MASWLALLISVISLVVSGITAYFNVILRKDDLRVVLGRPISVALNERGELVSPGAQGLTFVNAGGRTAVVTRVEAEAFPRPDDRTALDKCEKIDSDSPPVKMSFSILPLVIKPGEAQVLEAKLEQPGWFPTGDAGLLSYIRERIDKPSQNYLVCMEIEITTPDSAVASWRQPIFLLTKGGQGREYYGSRLLLDPSKPLTVIKESHNVFGW